MLLSRFCVSPTIGWRAPGHRKLDLARPGHDQDCRKTKDLGRELSYDATFAGFTEALNGSRFSLCKFQIDWELDEY